MAIFANDTFTAADLTALSAHTSDSGHSWAAGNGFSIANVAILSNAAYSSSTNSIGYLSATPGEADYTVKGTFNFYTLASGQNYGVIARAQPGATQWYSFTFDNSGFRVFKNASTQLGTTKGGALTAGVQYEMYLVISGSATTTIETKVRRLSDGLWLNTSGTWQAGETTVHSVSDSSSPVTAAGKAGIWLSVSNGVGSGTTITAFEASDGLPSAPTAGVASVTNVGSETVTVQSTAPTGGTSPFTYQWYRSESSGFTPGAGSLVAGADSLVLNDSGLDPGTTYFYVLRVTDNDTLTDDTSELEVTTATAGVASLSVFFSPYNWRSDGGSALQSNNVKGGSSYALSNNPGAYLKTRFSGTSVSLIVDVAALSAASTNAADYPRIVYSIDGGAATSRLLTASDTLGAPISLATGLSAGTHTIVIHFAAVGYNSEDRWVTPVMALKVHGLVLDSGASVSAADVNPFNIVVYGDSHGEGHEVNATGVSVTNQDASKSYGALIGASLGAEYGIVAFAGQGYTAAKGAPDAVPDAEDAWDFYSDGESRLVGGAFSPAPDLVISAHGDNDSDNAATATAVENLIGVWRTAAGSSTPIFIILPPNLTAETNIRAGVTAAADARVFVVDYGENLLATPAYVNGTHLSEAGQVVYASLISDACDPYLILTSDGGCALALPLFGEMFRPIATVGARVTSGCRGEA